MAVYFPSEINLTQISLGKETSYNKTDWSRLIHYGGGDLTIQLNEAKILFGLLSYSDPQKARGKESTGICMDAKTKGTIEFREMCENLEKKMVTLYSKTNNHQFVSCLKTNKMKDTHLRVKVPFKYNSPKFAVFINRDKTLVKKEDMKTVIAHGMIADVLLCLNPLWSSGGKFGISWKLAGIAVTIPDLREPPPPLEMLPRKRYGHEKDKEDDPSLHIPECKAPPDDAT